MRSVGFQHQFTGHISRFNVARPHQHAYTQKWSARDRSNLVGHSYGGITSIADGSNLVYLDAIVPKHSRVVLFGHAIKTGTLADE